VLLENLLILFLEHITVDQRYVFLSEQSLGLSGIGPLEWYFNSRPRQVQGVDGAIFQMISHGFISGALFLCVGVIYDRAHTRDISAFGGLAVKLPVYAGLMALTCFASLGLPGLAGFIGEFLCFLGAFQTWKLAAAISVLGIIATAAFFLRMMQKVFLGKFNEKWAGLPDMTARELVSIVPLAVLTVLFGVYPKWPLDLMNKTIEHMLGK